MAKWTLIYNVLIIFICSQRMVDCSGDDHMGCIQKMMPCESYLMPSRPPPPPPPPSCCLPLKEVVAEEKQCLCDVFNNEDILKTFNITQLSGLNLLKSCGVKVDVFICQNATSGIGSPPPLPCPTGGSQGNTSHKSACNSLVGDSLFLNLAVILSLLVVS